MKRIGAVSVVLLVGAMLAGNTGCYYDQWQATQRANRTLAEEREKLAADLKDAEAMLKQKDTQLDGLQKQLATKDDQVNSLSAENQSLRDALKKAQDILEAQAGKTPGSVIIQRTALPEKVANALEDLARKYPELLEFDKNTGAIRWKADLLFPLGSDALSDSSSILEPLKKFAEIVNMPEAKDLDVVIVGHTCNTPIRKAATLAEHKSNWHLSCHRSIAIMKMLEGQSVGDDRMGVMGYGEYRPIVPNDSQANKAKNRRVEIFLVQKGAVQSVGGGVYASPEQGAAYVKPAELPKGGAATAAKLNKAAGERKAPKAPKAAAKPAEKPAEADKPQ